MATYSLEAFDISAITTDDPDGFSDNGGYQFDLGVSTVTLIPGSSTTTLSVNDLTDATFDDDGGTNQVLNGAQTINGTLYADGTIIESEYELIVEDSFGHQFTLQFISVNNDAWNIEGFVVQGTLPPFNTPLTVIGRQDGTTGVYPYATSTPSCFGPDSRIRLATCREIRAAELRPGAHLALADGGAAPLDLVILSQTDPGDPAPQQAIRIRAHALGPDLPRRTLLLSGQHRVHLPALDALAPAKALTTLPRIGPTQLPPGQPFVHLVLRRHSLILADGLPCETFWPGDQALSTLPAPLRCKITRLMGLAPRPARPFLRVQEARKRLTAPTLPAT